MITMIVTNVPSSCNIRQLVEAGKSRGHETIVVNEWFGDDHRFNQQGSALSIEKFARPDTVLAWLEISDLRSGLSVLRDCDALGYYSPNSASSIERACDCLWQLQTLTNANVQVPRTLVINSADDVDLLPLNVGKGPYVLKAIVSPHVWERLLVAQNLDEARIGVERFRSLSRSLVVQQSTSSADEDNVRVLVIGYHAFGAVVRSGEKSVHDRQLACFLSSVKLTHDESNLAEQAACALDLAIADVSLRRTELGLFVSDVNPFPELQWWDGDSARSSACHLFDMLDS